jgi:hypothetical protein
MTFWPCWATSYPRSSTRRRRGGRRKTFVCHATWRGAIVWWAGWWSPSSCWPSCHSLSVRSASRASATTATIATGAGQQQNWILKCLQGVRAHPLAACGVATLCCSPPALLEAVSLTVVTGRRWRTEAFGTDTVFRRGGSLYDAGMRSQMGDYYNLSVGADEFNALGNPLGFSPAPQCVTGDHSSFVAVIDAGVSAARADQLARLLVEGGFLHRQVRRPPSLPPTP